MRLHPRARLTALQCVALLDAQGGDCPLCGEAIIPGGAVTDEHLRALGLAGTNALDNRAVVHRRCAEAKTYGPAGDLARIAKAKAQRAAVYGLTAGRSRRPMPGGRGDRLKRKVGGGVVLRATGEPA